MHFQDIFRSIRLQFTAIIGYNSAMGKYVFLILMWPSMLLAEAWRPSDFEIRGWNFAVSSTDTCSNVFSPIGLAVSVAMLGEATGDAYRAHIAEAMGLMGDFANTFSSLMGSYAESSVSNAVSISLAPSIWSRRIKSMDIGYRHSLLHTFGAVSGRLSTPVPINAWTEAATDGRLPQIVSKIDKETDLMLLNAIAFEGTWKEGFDKAKTRPGDFRTDEGKTVSLPFMHGTETIARIRDKKFEAIRIPFAAEGFNMIYLLPPKNMRIGKFRAYIGDKISIDELKSRFRVGAGADVDVLPVKLSLPRMELSSSWNLMPLMSHLKIPSTGYPKLGERLKLGEMTQAAYIKVTETGTSFMPGDRPPTPQAEEKKDSRDWQRQTRMDYDATTSYSKIENVRLDRPFVFLVWDINTDTIILAGQFTGK